MHLSQIKVRALLSSEPSFSHLSYPKDASQQVVVTFTPGYSCRVSATGAADSMQLFSSPSVDMGVSKSSKGSSGNPNLIKTHPLKTLQRIPTAYKIQIITFNAA